MTANKLKRIRKKLGLSQFAVSKAANVSRYKIAIYELGYGELKVEEIKRIEEVIKQ